MTDFSQLFVADREQKARIVHLVDKDSFAAWVKRRPAEDRALLEAHRFDAKSGFVILPRGGDFEVVSAVKEATELSPWCLARLAEGLPGGRTSSRKVIPATPLSAGCWLSTGSMHTDRRTRSRQTGRGSS